MENKSNLLGIVTEKFNKGKFILIKKLNSLFDYRKYIFLYLVVIAIFFFLFSKFGFLNIFKYKSNLFYILLFFVLTFLQIFFMSLKYSLFSFQKHSLKHIAYYISGLAVANCIPPRPLGEAMKVLIYKYFFKKQYSYVLLSVLFDDLFDVIFFLIIGLFAAMLLPFPSIFDRILLTLLYIILGLIFAYFTYYFIKQFNLKIKYRSFVFNFLGRLFDLFIGYIKKVKLLSFKLIFLGSFLTILRILIGAFRIYLIFLMFGQSISFFVVLGLEALCEIIGKASMLPGGLGAYELSFVYLSGVLGMNKSLSFGIILFERLFNFWIPAAIGFGVIIFAKKPLAQMRLEFLKYVEKQMSNLFTVYAKTQLKTKKFTEKVKNTLRKNNFKKLKK